MKIDIVGKQIWFVSETEEDKEVLVSLRIKALKEGLETYSDTTGPYDEGQFRWKATIQNV